MKFLIKLIPVILTLFVLLGCQEEIPQKETIRPVRAAQISDPSEFANRWFPGQAKATQEVDLSFRVAGPLIKFPVKVGDKVPKGHKLARIDPRDFQVELRNVQGQLDRAKAVLERPSPTMNGLFG
jgi:multidrug efflux pump subunit AcrA (membrane-fusion protein)